MHRRCALMIGNAVFEDRTHFTPLRTPTRDAQAVAATLKELGDFDVVEVLIDQEMHVLKTALEEFYAQADRGDLMLLYYSGHGFRAVDGTLYLVAKDTHKDRPLSTAVSAHYLRDAMRSSRSRHHVVMLDCCFSGAFLPDSKSGGDLLHLETLSGEARAILASSSRIQYSFEDGGAHSLFTEYLLRGIRTGEADTDRDGRLTVPELFGYVDMQVRSRRPEQTPLLHLDQRASELVLARGIETDLDTVYLGATVPADVFFSAWLLAKLPLNGYKVAQSATVADEATWPGEHMQALSRKAATYLIVVSHSAMQCPRVRSELAEVCKSKHRADFVIPVIVERLPATELPEELGQCEMIDFSQNWAHGLKQLIDRLQKVGVSRTPDPTPDGVLERWQQHLAMPHSLRPDRPERYRSTWFPCTLPQSLYVYTLDTCEAQALRTLPFPAVSDQRYVLSFAGMQALEGQPFQHVL